MNLCGERKSGADYPGLHKLGSFAKVSLHTRKGRLENGCFAHFPLRLPPPGMFKTGKGATVVVSADARARAAALFASSPLVERGPPTEGGAGGSGSVPSPIALRASCIDSSGLRAPFGPPPLESSHAAASAAVAAPARLPATIGFLTGKGVAVATDPAAVARMRAMLLGSPDGTDANDGADAIAGTLPPRRHAAASAAGAAPARLPATIGFLTGKGVAVATDPAAVARMRAMLLSSPDGADANDGADAIAGALPPRRGTAARPGAPAATNLGRSALKAFQTANGTIVGVAAAAGSKAAAGTAPALASGSNTVFGAGASAETGAGAGAAAPAGAGTATVNTAVTGGLQRRNPSLPPGKISGFKKPRTSNEVAMAAADRVDEPPGRSAASARGRPSALDAGRGGGKKPRFVAPRSVPSGHAQGKAPSIAAPPPVQPRTAPVMPEPSHCVCTQSVADWVPLHLRSCPCCCPLCNRPLARNGELVLHATHCLNVDINATLLRR